MTKGGKAKRTGFYVNDMSFGASGSSSSGSKSKKSKKIRGSKDHHDSLKEGNGNNTGKKRR